MGSPVPGTPTGLGSAARDVTGACAGTCGIVAGPMVVEHILGNSG